VNVRFAGVALALVASFTLAACNDQSESDSPDGGQNPRQLEIELDLNTKTVTAPPLTTSLPPHRAPATTRKLVVTTTTKPRSK
jgi:hypothetical protein